MNLKRLTTISLSTVFALVSLNAKGQDTEFRFGLKASGNLCWIKPNSKNIEGNGTKLGFSYGLMGDFFFQPNYAFSTELLITDMRGGVTADSVTYIADNSVRATLTNIEFEYKLRYVQIPLSIKFKTKEIGYITYWAQFGIAPSVLIRTRADISGSDLPLEYTVKDPTDVPTNSSEGDDYAFSDFEDDISFFRIPLIIGAGIEFNVSGNTSLYTGVRMDNGFSDIFKDDKTKAISNFVSLNAGVFF